jgi:hypothetical protein
VELLLFDQVAEVLHGLVPRQLGPLRYRAQRYGVKAWFGPDKAPPEHYEAQVLAARHVDDATVLALEIGFHAEHREVKRNDDALAMLLRKEKQWRRVLGAEAVAGPFIGRPDQWRRVSETWADPDLDEPDLAVELGTRLTDYVIALEPLLRMKR